MSTLSYEQQYQQILVNLSEVQREDLYVSALRAPEDAKSRQAYYAQYWLSLYVRYVRLARKLATIHDMELQPQRRCDVRTLLCSCMGRMLEARHYIVENCGDYATLDDTLEEMKLSPEDVEPPLPTFLLEDREESLLKERAYVVSLQGHYKETESEAAPVALAAAAHDKALFIRDPTKALPPLSTSAEKGAVAAVAEASSAPMPIGEAIRILQLAERGRQARQRAKIQLHIFRQQQYEAVHGDELRSITGKDMAATIIQKVVLGYLEQKRAKMRYQQEQELLGMASTEAIRSEAAKIAAGVRRSERKARQRVNQAELMQKTLEMERELKTREGPRTMEVMLDEVLMHMAYARLDGKAKDGVMDIPNMLDGGTLSLLGRRTRRPLSASASGGADAHGGSKASLSSARRSGRPAPPSASAGDAVALASGQSGRRQSPRRAGEDDAAAAPSPAVPPSCFFDHFSVATERHNTLWKEQFQRTRVENGDLDQPYDEALLRQELMDGPRGVMQELRQCVDQLVMIEVNNIKERLEAERRAGKKRRGGRKAKKAKAAKKPKLRDPTKGEDLESYLNTTIRENKLQLPPPEVRLSSFLGPANVSAGPLDRLLRTQAVEKDIEKKWMRVLRGWNESVEQAIGMPKDKMEALFKEFLQQSSWLKDLSAAEVRAAATEYAVLPLGSQVVHDLAPHPRGLLLYGAPGSGKTLLAYAIANESGARFFNLSPGNFLAIKGMVRMVQIVFYTARMKAPSVIYIDRIEKILPGKGLKGAKKRKDPEIRRGKKLKKELLKGIASLQPSDRVLIVATTTEPWYVDTNALCKLCQRAVHLTAPDYATRETLLRSFIKEQLETSNASPILPPDEASLARTVQQVALFTEGFSAGQLRDCVAQTLPDYRIRRLAHHPIEAEEFVPALAVTTGLSAVEVQRFHDFQASLPVTMRRANVAEDFQPTEEELRRR